MKNKIPHRYKLVVAVVLLGGGLIFVVQNKYLSQESKQAIKPVVKNGKVVVKSFQLPSHQAEVLKPGARAPNSAPMGVSKKTGESSRTLKISKKGQSKAVEGNSENNVSINGKSLVWLKKFAARPSVGSRINEGPAGFQMYSMKTPPSEFGVFDSRNLAIVTTQRGLVKLVVTGAIVVKLTSMEFVDRIALENDLEIVYLAPQIKTAVLRAKNGQNLLSLLKSVSSASPVKFAELELLGPGAEAK